MEPLGKSAAPEFGFASSPIVEELARSAQSPQTAGMTKQSGALDQMQFDRSNSLESLNLGAGGGARHMSFSSEPPPFPTFQPADAGASLSKAAIGGKDVPSFSFAKDTRLGAFAPAGQTAAPTPVASAEGVQKTAGKVLDAIVPDAIVVGESHGDTPLGQLGRGGNFGLISLKDGSISSFSAQYVKAGRLGPLNGAFSVVGTIGPFGNKPSDEAGYGFSTKIPTPIGDALAFINVRQNGVTGKNLLDFIQNNPRKDFTVSVNVGGAISVSDVGVRALAASTTGGTGLPLVNAGLQALGADAWVGLGWRGSLKVENRQPVSINISGAEIKLPDLGNFIGNALSDARRSPPLVPNRGSSAIASQNDNIQIVFGQSPWRVGFSAQDRDSNGALKIKNGQPDVLNHGNPVTAVTEPIYELGVKYGALVPGQPIKDNAHAGSVINQVLDAAYKNDQKKPGAVTSEYLDAIGRLNNPYGLNFGSAGLQAAQSIFNGTQVSPLPKDAEFVRGAFQGVFRDPSDNPPPPLVQPRSGLRL